MSAIVSIPISSGVTTITATTSGTAQTVFTVPSGEQYNIRLRVNNNTASNLNFSFFHDASIKTRTISSYEEQTVEDIVLTTTSATAFKGYVSAGSAIVTPLVFDINTI